MGEVITFTSGKGGVGKTTTTANVGAGLSLLDKKVVLVDTDIDLRNLDVVMGLENRIIYNLVDVIEGNCRMKQALMSDAISTAAGAMVGTSTVTTVVESSAGIAAGGRTGLTSLVTALMFLGAILFAPIVSIVPAAATAPALIFVGILMLGNIRDVDFSDMSNALPAFCTIVFMPFTYSIANGVAFGLITYCLMKLTTGRRQDVKVLTLAISVVFVVRYAFMTLG